MESISFEVVIILIMSGIAVGFINTLAGGATVISMSVFMALGMPIVTAAGTNRIPVMMQNLVSSLMFRHQKILSFKEAFRYSIPVIIGGVIGAEFTNRMSEGLFSLIFASGLLLFMAMLFFKTSQWLKEGREHERKVGVWHYLLLFVIGLYSGSIYVGMGYMVLMLFVLMLGFDMVRANAIKNFMALAVAPASLIIFMISGNVNYEMGLVHGIGNIIGAYVASKYASKLGAKFIRRILIVMVVASIIYTLSKPEVSLFVRSIL